MDHPRQRSCPPGETQGRRNHHGTGGREGMLPARFYDDPRLSAALARLEFGPVFRAVRVETRCSQHVLGALLGVDQPTISMIENGKRSLTDAATVIRVTNLLGIPAGKLGHRHGVTVTVEDEARSRPKGSWVQRRDFVQRVAGLTLATGVAGLDLDRLKALLPEAEPTGTRHVGAADVTAIEQATAEYARQDFAQGSGMIRDTAVSQLRATIPLLDAQMAPEVRPRLYLATGWLAMQAGWMSFDVTDDEAARRLWLIGLTIARQTEHPQGSDLTVYLVYDMALQAVRLDRPDEALKLVHIGQAAAAGTDVSPVTTSCLMSIQARAHAARSDAAGCDRALGQAVEYLTAIDPASTPMWGAHVGGTGLSAYHGAAYYELALATRDPRAAGRAVPLLRSAEGFDPGYARLRALYLPDLAGAHALAGDIDTAVSVGHQAVEAVSSVHSPRAYDRLRVLNTALEPLHTSPGVAELRDRLSITAA